MNFDNLDLYRFESPRFNIYSGKLIIKNGYLCNETKNGDKTHVKKLSLENKINLALILEKRLLELSVLPEIEELELRNPIEVKDNKLVFWEKDHPEVPLDYLNRLYTLFSKDESKLSTLDEIMNDIRSHIEEVDSRLRQEFGSFAEDIKPDLDQFDNWMYNYFEPHADIYSRYGTYHTGVYKNIIEELCNRLETEYNITRFSTYGDSSLFDLMASKSFFYVKIDEFKNSPHYKFIQHFTSEFTSHYDSLPIPSSGAAGDMYSEIVSNLHYSLYRYFNDGDLAEDIISEGSCLAMVNVIEYLSDLSSKRSLIFNYYYCKAMDLMHSIHMSSTSLPESLDDLINNTELKGSFVRWPEEISSKIIDGSILTDEKDYYDYYDLMFDWRNCEFMLLDAVDLLLAMYMIGKECPKLFEGLKVYDLRKRYWKS